MAEFQELPQDLVFVDLETTGGNAAYHRITEVGIVRMENGELVEDWSSLVNPECRIPSYIEAFTGITNEMVARAPRFADIAPVVLAKLRAVGTAAHGRPPVFVAHNARFDYSFLRMEFRRLEQQFAAQVLCTVKLSRRLFPEHHRHSLDAVMERHQLVCTARHRALGDARVLHDFWSKLRRDLPHSSLAAAAQAILGAGILPAHLPPGLADELPDGPGVYQFFGEDDVLLYIGKSNALRTRILGHFSAEQSPANEQKLARLVRRVDWLETGGELGALLLEAKWLKSLKPLYNRKLERKTQAVTLQLVGDGAALVPLDEGLAGDLSQCFGLFKSDKDARKALADIARAQHLCLKTLGLEVSAGSCVAYQMGKCKGACAGKEPLVLHRMRLGLALSSLKLKSWPFPGRIALRERSGGRDGDVHVFEHWVYLGTAHCDEELATLTEQTLPAAFDADIYRILVRHLARNPAVEWRDLSRPAGRSVVLDDTP